MAAELPLPHMHARTCKGITLLTDDALASSAGIRAAFTGIAGGISQAPYEGLNLGSHVGDDLACVQRNRALLLEALEASSARLVVPNQVHGSAVVHVAKSDQDSVCSAQCLADQGADALVVRAPNVAALLCFADCTPVIVAAPTGAFAVAHAGWRGAVAGIAGKAVRELAQVSGCSPDRFNAYIGPHIRQECFQTGPDVAFRFAQEFGQECLPSSDHVSLAQAVSVDLRRAGVRVERICDVGICTKCNHERFYSYRASGGLCGRHGAIAVQLEDAT